MESFVGIDIEVFIVLCLGLIGLSIGLIGFAWYYWVVVRPYRLFPFYRLDTTFLLKIIYWRFIYPRNISVLKVVFQEIINAGKNFSKEGCFVLWFFRPFVFIYNEEFNKVLCNDSAVANKSSIYELFKNVLGNGLLVSDEQTWAIHRKYLEPAFSANHLKGMMQTFNEKATDLVKSLEKVAGLQTEALEDFIKTCVFDAMTESLLGLNVKDENYETKIKNFMNLNDDGMDLIIKRLTHPWVNFNFISPSLSDGRRYLKGLEMMQQFATEAVKEMKMSAVATGQEEGGSVGKILLTEHLLEDHLTAKDVRDHINNIMVAGFNPVSRCLMWCFYLLGHDPEIQEKVYKEIASGVSEENVTCQDIANLSYLDCVIKETLRLYPSVPVYGRKLNKEIKCEKYTLPEGADVFFFPFMLHRNANLYTDPDRFCPERFSNLEGQPWIFIPFAEGYRNCIGKVFAQVMIKVILVHVIRKYKITSLSTFEERDLTWTGVLKPVKPFRVLLTFRNFDHEFSELSNSQRI